MNLNSVSNIATSYTQSVLSALQLPNSTSGATSSQIDASSLMLPQDSSAQLSPFAQMLSALQQLQQSNPTEYQQVTAQISTNLQNAAQTATADGNTSQATELNQLATDFSNASQNNTLPNIQDLAQAMQGSQGHHHHHHGGGASVAGSSDSSSTASGSSSSATTATSDLCQIVSAFLANANSSSQDSTLNPLAIISNTLTSAGISLS